MTDVRTLLREASPPPPPTLAMSRVLDTARARRHNRRRRFVIWTTGLLVLGAGGTLTDALVQASRPSTRIETTRPAPRDANAVTATTLGGARSGPPVADRTETRTATQSVARSGGTATVSGSGTAQSASEGCRVDQRSNANVQLSDDGAGGAGWDGYPSCGYQATVAGGYVAKGSWRIDITRDGFTFTLESGKTAARCATNLIQPGDQVTVYLRKGINSPDDWFIAVGPDQHCAT